MPDTHARGDDDVKRLKQEMADANVYLLGESG